MRGATVVTRTNDRDFWTFSEPSDASGRYTGFFPASDKTASDPVEFAVQVANGRTSYTTGARNPTFKRLASSNLDLRLPASGTTMALPTAVTTPGAIYRGLLVGVSGPNGVVKPVSATWPDALGRFTLVLPGSVKGSTAAVLAERLPVVHDRRGAGRPGRPRDLADEAVAPRLPRHRLRARPPLAGRPARRTALARAETRLAA